MGSVPLPHLPTARTDHPPPSGRRTGGGGGQVRVRDGMTSMQRLTNVQVRMLEFIDGWFVRRGRAPSAREISRGLGLKSSSGVQYHLRTLERRGLIVRAASRGQIRIVWRSVQLVDAVEELDGQLKGQMAEALRRLVNTVLPLQSREHLTHAELHYVRRVLALGIAVIQELDVLNAAGAPPRDGADRGLA